MSAKKTLIFWSLLFALFSADVLVAKDYKGLFGNYRRDQYTENEGLNQAFGVDFLLSTLFPITNVVTSNEGSGVSGPLYYATHFNLEVDFNYTVAYNWQFFLRFGYATYDTRKENSVKTDTTTKLPLFHEFQMSSVPGLAGFKYRFSRSDLVPYVGVAAGIVYSQRRATYDYAETLVFQEYLTGFAADVMVGFEFFFAARAGIRVEVSGFYMGLPQSVFAPSSSDPQFTIESNPIAFRYASGIFVIF